MMQEIKNNNKIADKKHNPDGDVDDNAIVDASDVNVAKPKSSLANALMRTFKGDITEELGDEAPEVIEQLVPGSNSIKKETSAVELSKEGLKDAQEMQLEVKERSKSVLHTYKDDIQNLVRRRKLSLTGMVAAEAGRETGRKYIVENKSKYKNNFIGLPLLVIALVILGMVALGGIYYTYIMRQAVGKSVPKHASLIFTDKTEMINTTDKIPYVLKQELTRFRDGAYYSYGSVIELLLTKKIKDQITDEEIITPLNTGDTLAVLGVTNANQLVDVFENNMMLGIYASENNAPFLIFKTKLYDYAFERLLHWEDSIVQDLAPLFSSRGEHVNLKVYSAGTSFADTVINNSDVRVLRDNDGKTLLLYSFVNKNTLVITTSVPAFVELVGRLRVAQ